MQLTYKTITGTTQAEFKDRGSKFIACSFSVNNTEDIKRSLQLLKKEHPKAVHHCYAYRLGTDGLQYRANDDGEPSGSAGRPILGQIDSAGLTNVLVVVVRYFGGTLLGVPGLINAYKTVTTECLSTATTTEKNIEYVVTLDFDYSLMNEVMQVLKQNDVSVYKQDMQLFCIFEIGIPLIHKEQTLQRLNDIHGLEIKGHK
ncbi:YigZ family protein [Taibaiella lutea]|uniref:YigZ family protein n=1 Tax=Taibaiella lutea TaxID=2608001 RepID=A0A5M6CK96_9BACT|nr:YigZ family protein [Taibaiella lutea]KAA5534860.1 YigZ family protein [Taibaiella lutea]